MSMRDSWKWLIGVMLAWSAVVPIRDAAACGCFALPNVSTPVVQAGERIAFAVKDSVVEAHIAIQYQGKADEFGWLLPLPSLPTLELGSDEFFRALDNSTSPSWWVNRLGPKVQCPQPPPPPPPQGGWGGVDLVFGFASDMGAAPGPSPVVVQDSVGPYDYAVLKADDKSAMLKWLGDNRYFVPAGTDQAVNRYIHQGAFFLALKLRSGQSAGDIQPVVVRYASDLPMIPIVLTSVGAVPDMNIWVWVFGAGRAIPRNYYHTVLNDATLTWMEGGSDYRAVVTRATKEAEKRHTFLTEYAGTTGVLGQIAWDGRFGVEAELAAITDGPDAVRYMSSRGFDFTVGLVSSILEKYFPVPERLKMQGITPAGFYVNIGFYESRGFLQGVDTTINGKALADELWIKVVKPTLAAGRIFKDHPYVTRLYTTLSPEDMTDDPVFGWNPSLPDVSHRHVATLQLTCDCSRPGEYDGVLTTEQGFSYFIPGAARTPVLPKMPESLRIEMLREAGAPVVVKDNTAVIRAAFGTPLNVDEIGICKMNEPHPYTMSCSTASRDSSRDGWRWLGVLGIPVALVLARRRRRSR